MDWEELNTTMESAGHRSLRRREVVAPAENSGVTTRNGRSG